MFRLKRTVTLLLTFLIIFQFHVTAQKKITVFPGQGLGIIKIGAHKDTVLKILRTHHTEINFTEEKTNFSDSEKIFLPQFMLGFDMVAVFNDFPVYQVYKAYFKNDSLNYLMITSYGFGSEKKISSYKTLKNVAFYDTKDKVKKVFGEPEKIMAFKNNESSFIYWSQGIEFVFEEDELVVINVFKPLPKKTEIIIKK